MQYYGMTLKSNPSGCQKSEEKKSQKCQTLCPVINEIKGNHHCKLVSYNLSTYIITKAYKDSGTQQTISQQYCWITDEV